MHRRTQGFTLVELLIVVAVIGILAAILVPTLLSARAAAQERAGQAYGAHVYTAATAFIASDETNTLETGDCGSGVSFGEFSVPDPGAPVTECQLVASESGTEITVSVTTTTGTVFSFGD